MMINSIFIFLLTSYCSFFLLVLSLSRSRIDVVTGNWTEHSQVTGGFYKCNRYEAGKQDASATAAQKAKAELDRYLHYYQRFHGHDSALKFASGQREQAERRMVERQEAHRSSWIDVQFLQQAAEQVIDCRRVLKYTYVLGYFLEDDSQVKNHEITIQG